MCDLVEAAAAVAVSEAPYRFHVPVTRVTNVLEETKKNIYIYQECLYKSSLVPFSIPTSPEWWG